MNNFFFLQKKSHLINKIIIVINNKKFPILENDVIIPMVIKITNNLYKFLKKMIFFFNIFIFFIIFK